ncbi:MAG: hypothetical protein WD509_03390 [Candidatus Paceibacterota bacterium]
MTNNEPEKIKIDDAPDEVLSSMIFRLGVLIAFLLVCGFVFSSNIFAVEKENVVATPPKKVVLVSPFEYVSIEAGSAYIYDVHAKKVLYTKNEDAQLPLASVTKLMTALVASKLIAPETIITIGEASIAIEGDNGFHIDEQWNFKDLLDYTLLVSSNDGAHAIATIGGSFIQTGAGNARDKFIAQMNEEALSLGLTQTYFLNESGLDANTTVGGGYGSARDIATLMTHIITRSPNLLTATTDSAHTFVSVDGFVYEGGNTNTTTGTIPSLLASKTGFTDLAGGNLAIAFDAGINRPIIVVVLSSSFDGRFKDIETLVSATLAAIAQGTVE